jgi:serine/threonine protein kinase
MASVWLALDSRLDRRVAVKLIADTLASDATWRARFAGEARTAASVAHPNVVRVFDYGFEEERPWLIMEYIEGGSLADVIAEGRSAELELGDVAGGLLSALHAVHAAGLVHRDVKPGNVLLDSYGHVRLTDFGIARRPGDTSTLTQTGMVLGTERYMAPEVRAGAPASAQSDLYSAGRVIGEVAGDRPPQWVRRLIESLAAENPLARPASAEDAFALAASGSGGRSAGETTATTPLAVLPTVPLPRPGSRLSGSAPARRRPRGFQARVLGVAVVAAVVVALVIVLAAGGLKASHPATGGKRVSVPGPAPRTASFTEQVNALQRIVEHAAGR